MEPQQIQKPRLTYAEFVAAKTKYAANTIAGLIERFIREMNGLDTGRPVKQIGLSHLYTLRRLQRSPIGSIVAGQLTKFHVIDHCKDRIKTVCPATINGDVGYLNGVLKYAPSAWDDCEDVSHTPVELALPMLKKYQLIGKSTPRKRRPTDAELEQLLAYFAIPPKKKFKKAIHAMPDIIAFALVSSRRLGEICRMTYGDIEWDKKNDAGQAIPMYMVRDLKHPKLKKGNNKRFPLFAELAEIIRRQPRRDPNNPTERVFPFNDKSVGQKYTKAKAALGILDLHFHDNRREAITRWLKRLPPHKVKLISGHETIQILERVYDAQKPEELHQELEAQLKAVDGQKYNHEPTWRS